VNGGKKTSTAEPTAFLQTEVRLALFATHLKPTHLKVEYPVGLLKKSCNDIIIYKIILRKNEAAGNFAPRV